MDTIRSQLQRKIRPKQHSALHSVSLNGTAILSDFLPLYLDDILFFSSTVDRHLERLEVVLGWLQQEGLKVKLSKCAFFQRQISYLGHRISDKGVSTDPSKVEAVANWEPPTTIYQLQSFLGFASYYWW